MTENNDNTQSSDLSPENSPQSSVLSTQSSFSWLITGGCGFIGRNLIKRLVAEGGHKIRVLDNLSVGTKEDLSEVCNYSVLSPQSSDVNPQSSTPVELFIGDIKDPTTCQKASEGTDIIVHLAANTGVGPSVKDPRSDMETNVFGTFNMLEAARQNKVGRFVFASSGAPVGECEPPIHEELAPHPVSPYGASKLAGEGYCSAYYRTFGLETVALRFGNVYGPLSGHKNSVIAKFIKKAMNGETLEIYGDGTQTRDFIYIDDLIDAIYKASTIKTKCSGLRSQDSGKSSDLIEDLPEKNTQSSVQSTQHSPFVSQSSVLSTQPSDVEPQSSVQSTQSSEVGPQSSVLSPQHCSIAGEVFQIATNKETTVSEMADILIPILNEKGIIASR